MKTTHGKWFWALVACLALLSMTLTTVAVAEKGAEGKPAQDKPAAAKADDDKVAVVNGTVITRKEFNNELARVQQQLMAMGRPVMGVQLQQVQQRVLDNLILRELLYQESQKEGIKASDEDINQQIDRLKKQFPSEEEYKNALKRMDLTEDLLKSQLNRDLSVQKLIENKFADKTTVTDEESKAYYDKNAAMFTQPEQVRASHILIKVDPKADEAQKKAAHKKIEDVQEKVKNGGDFSELAKEYSEGPSNVKGGDLGYFRRGQMVKPFEEVAFTIKPGEVSEIVETNFGYHLIKVTDKKPESVTPYDEIKEKLNEYLKREKEQKEVLNYANELRDKAKVETFTVEEKKD